MPNIFKGQVKLDPKSKEPRVRVFFGDACAGAFNAWLFDAHEQAEFIREGSNQAGQSIEFFLGRNALPTQPAALKDNVLAIDGNVASLLQQAGRYSLRIDVTQDGLGVGSPLAFAGDLNPQGVAAFTAYVTLG